jgi:hypothetical protein
VADGGVVPTQSSARALPAFLGDYIPIAFKSDLQRPHQAARSSGLCPVNSKHLFAEGNRAEIRLVQRCHPLIDLLARRILAQAIALLDLTLELLALARDPVEIIIREITPLLLDLAL